MTDTTKNTANNSIEALYHRPLISLVQEASQVHKNHFPQLEIQASSLLSIKTGGCPENCSYCPQSAHYKTGVNKNKLLALEEVLSAAEKSKQAGATRFCMGAAWREVKSGPEFESVLEMVKEVSKLGLEVCCTLGMLAPEQARQLKNAGLNFYNHNIDTSPEFYEKIIQTRTFQERLDTIQCVRDAGISVCTGGILGLGESTDDRISFIHQLTSMNPQPESITINVLIPISGTPLEHSPSLDPFELVRVIAVTRLKAPRSMIRLSAGRTNLSHEVQFLCFLAGANSLFLGEKLLTSPNPEPVDDMNLLAKSGLKLSSVEAHV